MSRPILGQDYPRLGNPILDQIYPRWNNLFDTMNFDDPHSLRRILMAAFTAESLHPFNLKLIGSITLSNAEMIALRDISYAFNRNYLCRDMVRHLMLFARYEDEDFPLGKEARFYMKMLKKTNLSPVRQPDIYLLVRREFCRLAPDLRDLDENEAAEELKEWGSWGLDKGQKNTEAQTMNTPQMQHDGPSFSQGMDINLKNGNEVLSEEITVEPEVLEAAKILMSMSQQ